MVLPHSWSGAPDAPVLVLSNSLGTVQSMWDEVMPWFEERFHVLTYDLPGHHGPTEPFGFRAMVDETIDLLDSLGISGAVMAGVSVGGAISVATAAARPDIVSAAVTINAPIQQSSSQFWYDRAETVERDGLQSIADGMIERWFGERSPAADRIIGAFLELDPAGYAAACRALADLDVVDDASNVPVPTLIISAADDVSVPAKNAEEFAARIADSVLWRVDHGGHLLPVRRPETVGPLIVAFADARAR